MNINRLAGHITGAVAFTALWEFAVSLPAGSPGWHLVVAGLVGPPAVAGVSVTLQELSDRGRKRVGYQRAVTARQRRPEITRPPLRKELAR